MKTIDLEGYLNAHGLLDCVLLVITGLVSVWIVWRVVFPDPMATEYAEPAIQLPRYKRSIELAGLMHRLLRYLKEWIVVAAAILLPRLLRYAIAATYATIAVRVWAGWYWTPVEPSELLVNVLVMYAVYCTGGNVEIFLQAARLVKSRK
ncbi:hypothetical protein HDG34_005889 [Paraburkholderia sp. HC6.4b]|uniref:hypothetical protein n=1 Tax=unclassified Paraburkholderia TaxID=2615204 RepID=UPI00160A3506|nr:MULTISPECIES: hypothetical protein [unclassified Paraburkholderia]MBB5411923.1 hypothetical protein [Paraburkholderia sp. HC6.4b]MBB5450235.1 hypothetical protein [Paraburkholderia sp. Kb1A]